VQPPTLQLDRAPHRSPARETAPPSLLARTRSAVRDRFRGTVGSDAPSHLDEVPELTVGAFLESWLTEIARVTVRPRTYVSYRYVVRFHLTPGLGDLPLAFLSPADVQAFLNAKSASGLSPRTVGYLRGVLRGALGHAERTDLVPRNVARLARPESLRLALPIAGRHVVGDRVPGHVAQPVLRVDAARPPSDDDRQLRFQV